MPKPLSSLKGKARRKRVAQLSKNPETRVNVPTKDLSPEHQKLRRQARRIKARDERQEARRNEPFLPGSDVTRRSVMRDMKSATRLQYGDAERLLGQQLQDSQRFADVQIPEYFRQYQDTLREAGARTQAAAAATAQQVQAFGQGIGNIGAQQQQQINQQMQADAATRGATVSSTVNQQGENASQIRQAMNDSFGAMLAGQGRADTQRMIEMVPIAARRGIEESLQERGRSQRIVDDQGQLAREKGDFKRKYLQERSDQERKAILERLVFGAEVADKQADNARQERNDRFSRQDRRADNRLARQRERRTARTEQERLRNERDRIEISRENARDNGTSGTSRSDKFGNTPRQRREAQSSFDHALRTAKNALSDGVNPDTVYRLLVEKMDVDPAVARAAVQKARTGKLGPKNRRAVRSRGIRPPKTNRNRQAASDLGRLTDDALIG